VRLKRIFVVFVLILSLGGGMGSVFGAETSSSAFLTANPLDGSQLFQAKGCPRCHSIYGAGGGAGPDLGQGILKRSLLDIAGEMWNHSPGMAHVFQEQRAVRPTFKPEEMASLLSFLYYLGSMDPPGDAALGQRVFVEKRCQSCHSIGGKGGTRGPKLDKYAQYASPIYLTAALWNHGRAMSGVMEQLQIPRPVFEKNDIPNLLAYIRTVGGEPGRVYIAPGNLQRGEKLFSEKQCVRCHSGKHDGGPVGPNLRATTLGSLMTIAGAMWNHAPKMWGAMNTRGINVPSITSGEMSDLMSYVYFLQFIDLPGDAKRGNVVYQEKGCGKCHTLPGVAGTVGPDLTKVAKLQTPLEVVTEMWNHASTMEQKMLEESVVWPVFKGGEMSDLVAYLLSLRRETISPVTKK
jgi:cytochrome c2